MGVFITMIRMHSPEAFARHNGYYPRPPSSSYSGQGHHQGPASNSNTRPAPWLRNAAQGPAHGQGPVAGPGPSSLVQGAQGPQALPTNAIIVSKRQMGNPVLKFIRNVRWQFGEIAPDYVVGQNACVLFLSLRYGMFGASQQVSLRQRCSLIL